MALSNSDRVWKIFEFMAATVEVAGTACLFSEFSADLYKIATGVEADSDYADREMRSEGGG